MEKIKIELSYDVARHYGFTYLWKVHRRGRGELLRLEGGFLREGVGQLGSIPIKIKHNAGVSGNEMMFYVARRPEDDLGAI